MVPKEVEQILESTPDTLGGAVRFRGTRIHAKILFDYVLGGGSLEQFLENYPDIRREDAEKVLRWERENVEQALMRASAA